MVKMNKSLQLDDFKEYEWEAVSRVMVKCYREVQFFPILLNRVFLFSTLFDGMPISHDVLLSSFLVYASRDERELFLEALKEVSEEHCLKNTIKK